MESALALAHRVATASGGWTGDAVATVLAATIAAVAAMAGLAVSLHTERRTRDHTRSLTDRDQWWRRFTWAVEKAISTDPAENEVGLATLIHLLDAPWATKADSEICATVATMVKSSHASKGAPDD